MTLAGRPDRPESPPPLALSMGEPAGIGGEIALKAWRALRDRGLAQGSTSSTEPGDPDPKFFLIDDPARLESLASRLDLEVPVQVIASPALANAVFADALPILPLPVPVAVEPGRPDPANAPAVLASIGRAVELARDGLAAAVVTNPVHKKLLYDTGFQYPGQTEYLAALASTRDQSVLSRPVMMLACPGLRVVPVTVHLPLAQVATTLSEDIIVHAGEVTAEALRRDFEIDRPRLAVAGLNPHAGEDGALGREEAEVIAPAVARLRRAGLDVTGPAPADTLFRAEARASYDAALCMYHDQALIPLKTIDYAQGINITLGLPFVRTSPDHGTALDIAGQGRADPTSLIAALTTARRMAGCRAAAKRLSVA